MRRVRGSHTAPELDLRKALWRRGLRYRVCVSSLPGKPDLVLRSSRTAVFVDGDFWHGGQWVRRNLRALEDQFRHTKTREYWLAKIRRNMLRDCSSTAALLSDGWTVIRFWESEVRRALDKCVRITLETVESSPPPDFRATLPRKTCAEFFAGIGLMRLGLERQGWTVCFANDIDSQKLKMYQGHFGDSSSHLVLEDVHKISADSVPTTALATASFPCNDLSLAGSRSGLSGRQSSAFWGFIRVLREMGNRRPPLVLLENVPGFLSSRRGDDFRQALEALNELGYSVDAFMVDAASFVPHSRMRLFVLACVETPSWGYVARENLQFYSDAVRPKALGDFIWRTWDTIRWRVRALPPLPERTANLEGLLEDVPEGAPIWWSTQRVDYLLNQMSPRHQETARAMQSGDGWSYGTVFRRVRNGKSMAELRGDGVAGCLRTPRGGSGRQILFRAGNGACSARLLTPRECARLMGADDFRIDVPMNQALFGFGDAVCVPVVEWIAANYLNPLVAELMRGHPMRADREGDRGDDRSESAG